VGSASKPKRRLFEVLKSQGMQPNQQITFLTDGGEDVRDLPLYLNPQSEHVLDWFHITMRLTVLSQMAKGVRSRESPRLIEDLMEELEGLKCTCGMATYLPGLVPSVCYSLRKHSPDRTGSLTSHDFSRSRRQGGPRTYIGRLLARTSPRGSSTHGADQDHAEVRTRFELLVWERGEPPQERGHLAAELHRSRQRLDEPSRERTIIGREHVLDSFHLEAVSFEPRGGPVVESSRRPPPTSRASWARSASANRWW
jgi:hypothetical protein